MKPRVRDDEVFDAIQASGHGAFAYLCARYPEEAVMRAFLAAERRGYIERVDGKLSKARLTSRIERLPDELTPMRWLVR